MLHMRFVRVHDFSPPSPPRTIGALGILAPFPTLLTQTTRPRNTLTPPPPRP